MPLGNSLQSALQRLKKQRDEDYLSPWSPTKGRSDAEILWDYILDLKSQIGILEEKYFLTSWATNPDRMGGQFSQDEIDRARGDTW